MLFSLRSSLFYPLLFLFCLIIFLTHYIVSRQAVYGDGIGYYAHVRSWVIDGDWDTTNEYKHLYNHDNNNAVDPNSTDLVQIVPLSKKGVAANHFSTGVAVLLLPFYLLAHLIAVILNYFSGHFSTTGYGDLYQIVSGSGAVLYFIMALWFVEQILNILMNNKEVSRLCVATLFLSTHLLYYGSYDVLNSHFASFFLITIFLYFYLTQKYFLKNILFLGMIGGLLAATRPQDGVIAILWFAAELVTVFRARSEQSVKIFLYRILCFTLGFLFGVSTLLYQINYAFGDMFEHTYLKGIPTYLHKERSIDLLGSLFHSTTGLFAKAPILLVVLIYFISKMNKLQTKYLLFSFLFFLIQVVIITIQQGWSAEAYGGRMYTSSLIFFALVLGILLKNLQRLNSHLPYIFSSVFICISFISFAFFVLQ